STRIWEEIAMARVSRKATDESMTYLMARGVRPATHGRSARRYHHAVLPQDLFLDLRRGFSDAPDNLKVERLPFGHVINHSLHIGNHIGGKPLASLGTITAYYRKRKDDEKPQCVRHLGHDTRPPSPSKHGYFAASILVSSASTSAHSFCHA